jgi:hypothetical protein
MERLGALAKAFQLYGDDMERCRQAKAFWSLLHVTVCLPDLCAALEAADGAAKGKHYEAWCEKYLAHPKLTGPERWALRNKVLHQGRAATDKPGRYARFAFGQPADTGEIDHMRVVSRTLHLDVGELARETWKGVEAWISELRAHPRSVEAQHVKENFAQLVRVNTVLTRRANPGPGDLTETRWHKTR